MFLILKMSGRDKYMHQSTTSWIQASSFYIKSKTDSFHHYTSQTFIPSKMTAHWTMNGGATIICFYYITLFIIVYCIYLKFKQTMAINKSVVCMKMTSTQRIVEVCKMMEVVKENKVEFESLIFISPFPLQQYGRLVCRIYSTH